MTQNTLLKITLFFLLAFLPCKGFSAEEKKPEKPLTYPELILSEKPIAYWRFEEAANSKKLVNHSKIENASQMDGEILGTIDFQKEGPREPEFPKLPSANQCIQLKKPFGQITIQDPGDDSPIDFKKGDGLTIEAWVKPDPVQAGEYLYILGKGRSATSGEKAVNQNYAMRLKVFKDTSGKPASFAVSFLFHSDGEKGDWHRWTSNIRLPIGDGWHHVAITYQFGKTKSIHGYLDGEHSTGKWDKAGDTKNGPVVDNDILLIGTAMNHHAGNSYLGSLDELAIYKKVLSSEDMKQRYHFIPKPLVINWDEIPNDLLRVEIHEDLFVGRSWKFRKTNHTDTFPMKYFAFPEIPHFYSKKGILTDRSSPFLMRALGKVRLPEKKLKLLLRARNASKLYIDDKLVLETGFHSIPGNAHGRVSEEDHRLTPHMPHKTRGDFQKVYELEGDGKLHQIRFDMIVGGQSHRFDLGETAICIAEGDQEFQLLAPKEQPTVSFTEKRWRQFLSDSKREMYRINEDRRRVFGQEEDLKWAKRHSEIREALEKLPAIPVPNSQDGYRENNDIDRFINETLAQKKLNQSEQLDDLAFLRKLAIDTQGAVPTLEQIQTFLNDSSPDKRNHAIDRFLKEEEWADNWMGYWQDVLAENPNIINPTLNNTGPFRWWIHESFFENKPFDRFATELIEMEGSKLFGGPAGFEIASQNDAPYAAKAHIIGQAFLAVNMKCARCHDAPFRDFKQKDLFSIAAMLKKSPQGVPKTSSIPGFDFKNNSMLVNVTLKPGEKVSPNWPFENIVHSQIVEPEPKTDTRTQLAKLITSPQNERFSKVIVNRVWKRCLGAGLVEPVDDWQDGDDENILVLDYLSREFMKSGYDLKALSRLIFQSDLYQRKSVTDFDTVEKMDSTFHFASPVRRRMRAEQIVDSLFKITNKPLNAGHMSLDLDGSRRYNISLHLGTPEHAWEFSSSSNERDRPSLSLPFAEPFLGFLKTFGWRDTRQAPITEREINSTALQAAIMANGVLSQRFTRCSDDSSFTEIALKDQDVKELVDLVYLKTLTRYPTKEESETLTQLLKEGYEKRKTGKPAIEQEPPFYQHRVTWSNHLHTIANSIMVDLRNHVQNGDPPSPQLDPEWRQNYEDVLWVVWNSPEFLHVP